VDETKLHDLQTQDSNTCSNKKWCIKYFPPWIHSRQCERYLPRVLAGEYSPRVLAAMWNSPDAEDLLWHLGWFVNNEASSRPRWAGFMHDEEHSIPPSATVRMFLFIECNANNYSCIYCSLRFICQQSASLQMPTPCVTFDQLVCGWQPACAEREYCASTGTISHQDELLRQH